MVKAQRVTAYNTSFVSHSESDHYDGSWSDDQYKYMSVCAHTATPAIYGRSFTGLELAGAAYVVCASSYGRAEAW